MNTKTLLAGLVGGIAAFLLGMVIYGMLLKSFMEDPAHYNQCASRGTEMKDMIMWALICGNLFWGMSVALLLSWANVNSFMDGMTKGAVFGLVLILGFDLSMYSMSTWFADMTALVVDILVCTVMNALIGGVVGWMLGRGNTAAA